MSHDIRAPSVPGAHLTLLARMVGCGPLLSGQHLQYVDRLVEQTSPLDGLPIFAARQSPLQFPDQRTQQTLVLVPEIRHADGQLEALSDQPASSQHVAEATAEGVLQ